MPIAGPGKRPKPGGYGERQALRTRRPGAISRQMSGAAAFPGPAAARATASAAHSAEQFGERLAEAGKDLASVEYVALVELARRDPAARACVAGVDLHAVRRRIEDPDAAHAEPQILGDLGADCRRTVARGEDLDGQIRGDFTEGRSERTGRQTPPHHATARRAEEGVRTTLQQEPARIAQQIPTITDA